MVIINRVTNKPLNIAGATEYYFIFDPPSEGGGFMREAAFSTNGSDGKLKYILEAGDIFVEGTWQVQAFVKDALGEWHADIETFEVGANLVVEVS
jgi:hypothetical protein